MQGAQPAKFASQGTEEGKAPRSCFVCSLHGFSLGWGSLLRDLESEGEVSKSG